ncbi:MAG TPA: hypothetical protein VIT19_03070 [Pyrinomonadaceae bacterium]
MKKTSRRDFGKQLGLTLGALPIAALATETVAGQKKRKFTGDPITVGGGGGNLRRRGQKVTPPPEPVYADFNENIYKPVGNGSQKTFKNTNGTARMSYLVVVINNDTFNLTPLLPRATGECRIELSAPGRNNNIEVWGDRPVRIRFDLDNYGKSRGGYRSKDPGNFIEKIAVETPLGKFERARLTAADKITILTDTVSS